MPFSPFLPWFLFPHNLYTRSEESHFPNTDSRHTQKRSLVFLLGQENGEVLPKSSSSCAEPGDTCLRQASDYRARRPQERLQMRKHVRAAFPSAAGQWTFLRLRFQNRTEGGTASLKAVVGFIQLIFCCVIVLSTPYFLKTAHFLSNTD